MVRGRPALWACSGPRSGRLPRTTRRIPCASLWHIDANLGRLRVAVARAIDFLAIVLLAAAIAAFFFGLRAIATHDDLRALYLGLMGAMALRSSVEILRPRASGG